MEAGFIVPLGIAVLFGIVIGVRIKKSDPNTDDPNGVLNVAYNESYGGYDLFLNLQMPVEDVMNRKQVTFHVNVIRTNSQK